MALDFLQQIKSVEEEAEGKIRSTRQRAAREVEEAGKKQQDEFVSVEKRCREDLRNVLDKVEEEAKGLREEQDGKVAQERQAMREAAEKQMPEAVEYIISEITK